MISGLSENKPSLTQLFQPEHLSGMVGSDNYQNRLSNLLRRQKMGDGIAILGSPGSGLTSTTRLLLMILCCEMPDNVNIRHCSHCYSCKNFDLSSSQNSIRTRDQEVELFDMAKDGECDRLIKWWNWVSPCFSTSRWIVLDNAHLFPPRRAKALADQFEQRGDMIRLLVAGATDEPIPKEFLEICPVKIHLDTSDVQAAGEWLLGVLRDQFQKQISLRVAMEIARMASGNMRAMRNMAIDFLLAGEEDDQAALRQITPLNAISGMLARKQQIAIERLLVLGLYCGDLNTVRSLIDSAFTRTHRIQKSALTECVRLHALSLAAFHQTDDGEEEDGFNAVKHWAGIVRNLLQHARKPFILNEQSAISIMKLLTNLSDDLATSSQPNALLISFAHEACLRVKSTHQSLRKPENGRDLIPSVWTPNFFQSLSPLS